MQERLRSTLMITAYLLKYAPVAIGCSMAVSKIYPQSWIHAGVWALVAAAAYGDYFIRTHIRVTL